MTRYPRRRPAGFTLLEMMLVVLLIGITVTFVNLNLQPDPADIARREADRFAALVRQLREESILSGRALAVEYDGMSREYRFAMLDGGKWARFAPGQVFRSRKLPRPLSGELKVPGSPADGAEESATDAPTLPRVVVDPVGEIDAFEFTLRAGDAAFMVTLDDHDAVAVTVPEQP